MARKGIFQKRANDDYMKVVGYAEIEKGKRELARALLDEGAKVPVVALKRLRQVRKISEPAPYLVIDEATGKILIRQNRPDKRVEIVTDFDGTRFEDPNDHPEARKQLERFAEDRRFALQARHHPEDIRLSAVFRWDQRMIDTPNMSDEPIDPSPTIDQATNGGYPWLEIECSRCKTRRHVDLAALRHPPTTFVHDLASRLRCSKCTKAGKRPPATLLQLDRRARHDPSAP